MKITIHRIILSLVAFLLSHTLANAQITLTTGSSYTFSFSTMAYQGTQTTHGTQATFALEYNNSDLLYSDNADWTITVFDPSISGTTPFFTGQHAIAAAIVSPTNAWQNLAGSAFLTVTSGTITLDSLVVRRFNADHSFYSNTVAAVPEPSSCAFLLLGITSTIVICKKGPAVRCSYRTALRL